jgi:hypothetical protein
MKKITNYARLAALLIYFLFLKSLAIGQSFQEPSEQIISTKKVEKYLKIEQKKNNKTIRKLNRIIKRDIKQNKALQKQTSPFSKKYHLVNYDNELLSNLDGALTPKTSVIKEQRQQIENLLSQSKNNLSDKTLEKLSRIKLNQGEINKFSKRLLITNNANFKRAKLLKQQLGDFMSISNSLKAFQIDTSINKLCQNHQTKEQVSQEAFHSKSILDSAFNKSRLLSTDSLETEKLTEELYLQVEKTMLGRLEKLNPNNEFFGNAEAVKVEIVNKLRVSPSFSMPILLNNSNGFNRIQGFQLPLGVFISVPIYKRFSITGGLDLNFSYKKLSKTDRAEIDMGSSASIGVSAIIHSKINLVAQIYQQRPIDINNGSINPTFNLKEAIQIGSIIKLSRSHAIFIGINPFTNISRERFSVKFLI